MSAPRPPHPAAGSATVVKDQINAYHPVFFNYEHLQYGHLCKSTLIGHINECYFWCLRWKLSHWVQRCSSLRIVITISYSFKLSFSKKSIGCTVNKWIKVCFNWSYKTHKFTTFPEGTSTSEVTSMLKSSP